MHSLKMVFGGERTDGSSDQWLEVANPATEEVEACVPDAGPLDVDGAVQSARLALDDYWGRMAPAERGKLLYRLSELIEKHADELALLDTKDMGKPYKHAREDDVPPAALSRAHRVAARVDSGLVWVNCNNYLVSSIPYEGHRQSGIGSDLGLEVLEGYTKLKSVVVNLDRTPHPWPSA